MGARRVSSRHRTALLWSLSLVAILWFLLSFFLAKQSLPLASQCTDARSLLQDTLGLTKEEVGYLESIGFISVHNEDEKSSGCWMNRTVDSLLFIVVDALRFDFALYDLPKSIGQHLSSNDTASTNARLYQFVADPPTVTVQRLKALTTGGLPTFADLSTNFGGASVPDDNWINQIKTAPYKIRGLEYSPHLAFVGDDTWADLFPESFDIALPYPSFNTRDLDTVDNGCLEHLPELLPMVRSASRKAKSDDLEVLVVHFLGVDHVGHTYGPFNEHMTTKLNQMDDALSQLLARIDQETESCQMAMIMGDHGMTPDGNHGGGTPEEVNAALFVYSSPACQHSDSNNIQQDTVDASDRETNWMQDAFTSIHQIDLVPTLSALLGLPIPFANVGTLMVDLLPARHQTVALALNSAQIWRYFTVYSQSAQKLPGLAELELQLKIAVDVFKKAIEEEKSNGNASSDIMAESMIHFKEFGSQALELAQRVWTRFDMVGMITSIVVMFILDRCLSYATDKEIKIPQGQHKWEVFFAALFVLYHVILLSFSNSYIYEEQTSQVYCLTVLSLLLARRLYSTSKDRLWRGVIMISVMMRCHVLFVSGHGLDPSLGMHIVHHPAVFLTTLALLISFRYELFQRRITTVPVDACSDILAMLLLAACWLEKRSQNIELKGYRYGQLAIATQLVGLLLIVLRSATRRYKLETTAEDTAFALLSKLLIGLLIVTGPSSSSTLVLYLFQAVCVYSIAYQDGPDRTTSFVIVVLWRFITRATYLSTNHAFAFNRLQFSAAFVATEEFNFHLSGTALFLNTFGWEIAGIILAWLMSRQSGREGLWIQYGTLHLKEAIFSCISVTLLRRHLMVWDIYAPHLIFVSCFTTLHIMAQIIDSVCHKRQPTNDAGLKMS